MGLFGKKGFWATQVWFLGNVFLRDARAAARPAARRAGTLGSRPRL